MDSEGNVLPNVNLAQMFAGLKFDGSNTTSSTARRTPGVYTQTVLAYGNYLPEPVIRIYTISRQTVKIDANKTVVSADGTPKEVSFTVTTEDGSAATAATAAAKVEVVYVGMTDKGKTYNSSAAPTEAGLYTVTFTYEGNDQLAPSVKVVTLEITAPQTSLVGTIVRGIVGIFKKK